jgi:hypothetical protein
MNELYWELASVLETSRPDERLLSKDLRQIAVNCSHRAGAYSAR